MHTVHDTHFRQNGIDQDSQFSQFILIFTWFRLASDVSIVEMPTDIVQSIKYLTLPYILKLKKYAISFDKFQEKFIMKKNLK